MKTRYQGKKNLCGGNISKLRKSLRPKVSQRDLADKLQLVGMDVDKNAISLIENGDRFITDIELKIIATFFSISTDELLSISTDGLQNTTVFEAQ